MWTQGEESSEREWYQCNLHRHLHHHHHHHHLNHVIMDRTPLPFQDIFKLRRKAGNSDSSSKIEDKNASLIFETISLPPKLIPNTSLAYGGYTTAVALQAAFHSLLGDEKEQDKWSIYSISGESKGFKCTIECWSKVKLTTIFTIRSVSWPNTEWDNFGPPSWCDTRDSNICYSIYNCNSKYQRQKKEMSLYDYWFYTQDAIIRTAS